MCSVPTQAIGSDLGMGASGTAGSITFPSRRSSCAFDGPSCSVTYMANVGVCTTDDFTECVGALMYGVDPGSGECKTYNLLFDRNIIDCRSTVCSVPTPAIGSDLGLATSGTTGSTTSSSRRSSCVSDGPSCSVMYMANVGVCTTDDFTEYVGALVYYIDPEDEGRKIAYPNLLLGRNAIDGRGMMCSGLAPSVARPWATSKRQDLRHLLPAGVPAPFDGPSCDIMDMADVNVCTTTGFTKRVGALAYCVDPESGECKIAYPDLLSGRSSACAIQSSSACRLRSWRSSARFFQDGLNCWLRS